MGLGPGLALGPGMMTVDSASQFIDVERGGFEATVLPLRPLLYGRALRLCRDPQQAEDLVQDTVMRAWRFWPSFRQGTNCAAWLRTILTHSFINGCRRRARERNLLAAVRDETRVAEEVELRPEPADLTFADEVLTALQGLSPEFRTVLECVDVEGLSYQATAERLGCPVGTVMSRLHRARRLMRGALESYAVEQGYVNC